MADNNNSTKPAASAPTPEAEPKTNTNADANPAKPESAVKVENDSKPDETPKSGRPASLWSKAQLIELATGEKYCLAAMQDKYKAIFLKAEFPPERLTAFHLKIKDARNQTATAGQCGTVSEVATLDQATAEKRLLADIRKVQAAAKQKHARTNPTVLKDFLVGTNVNQSEAGLQQHSQTLLKKLETERPPGIDTEVIENLTTHRAAFVGGGMTQGATDSDAEQERYKRNEQIEKIKDERIEIQFVIDGAFGPGDPAHAAVRREFGLPPNRPFNAVRRKSA